LKAAPIIILRSKKSFSLSCELKISAFFISKHFKLGSFSFDKIGIAYPDNIPLKSLRFLPALCGSLITPTAYLILCQLGLSPWAGALAGLLIVFGGKQQNFTK